MLRLTQFVSLILVLTINVFSADVTGKISFSGASPKMPKIKMDADKTCKAMQ